MAKPIKPTPVVRGNDALKLWDLMRTNESRPVDKKEVRRIRESAKLLKSIAQFKNGSN